MENMKKASNKHETKFNQEKVTFPEEEAINITIEHGYDGSEFKTSVWNKRGCLSTNRTLDALIRKLETIYYNVQVKGKGKRRNYILKNKKEEMSERKFNYKGTVQTEEEKRMEEYIFNILVKADVGNDKPYSTWIRDFDLFQPRSFSSKQLTEEIKEVHMGVLFNPKEIVFEFTNAMNNYNKSIVENSFRRLEMEGRITRSISYFFRTLDGNYEEVDKERYEEATNFKKELVESYDIEYNQYIQGYFSSGHRSSRMQYIIDEVNEQMEKMFGIKYLYQAIGISVIAKDIRRVVSKEDFDQAYFQRFIKLAMRIDKIEKATKTLNPTGEELI